MSVAEVRALYDEKLRGTAFSRWGSFDRQLVGELLDEIARLKAGRFTEEEVQALCHEQGEGCPARFARGCVEYNRKLFGERSQLREAGPPAGEGG